MMIDRIHKAKVAVFQLRALGVSTHGHRNLEKHQNVQEPNTTPLGIRDAPNALEQKEQARR